MDIVSVRVRASRSWWPNDIREIPKAANLVIQYKIGKLKWKKINLLSERTLSLSTVSFVTWKSEFPDIVCHIKIFRSFFYNGIFLCFTL